MPLVIVEQNTRSCCIGVALSTTTSLMYMWTVLSSLFASWTSTTYLRNGLLHTCPAYGDRSYTYLRTCLLHTCPVYGDRSYAGTVLFESLAINLYLMRSHVTKAGGYGASTWCAGDDVCTPSLFFLTQSAFILPFFSRRVFHLLHVLPSLLTDTMTHRHDSSLLTGTLLSIHTERSVVTHGRRPCHSMVDVGNDRVGSENVRVDVRGCVFVHMPCPRPRKACTTVQLDAILQCHASISF